MTHYKPNDRPAHPACRARHDDNTCVCMCSFLWDYWDGTSEQLDERIETNRLLETRNRAHGYHYGNIADLRGDEITATAHKGRFESIEDVEAAVIDNGFWSVAEELKTIRGDKI